MNGTTRSSMRLLTVRHVTTYRYSKPVGLGEHRMMFRPRESHDLRLVKTKLDIVPQPVDLRWLHDVPPAPQVYARGPTSPGVPFSLTAMSNFDRTYEP